MSEEAREKLRKIRGQVFYVYDSLSKSLIFIFDSKQYAYNNIKLDHRTLDNCLYNGNLYLDRFLFTLEPLLEFNLESLMTIEELKILIKEQRYKISTSLWFGRRCCRMRCKWQSILNPLSFTHFFTGLFSGKKKNKNICLS